MHCNYLLIEGMNSLFQSMHSDRHNIVNACDTEQVGLVFTIEQVVHPIKVLEMK